MVGVAFALVAHLAGPIAHEALVAHAVTADVGRVEVDDHGHVHALPPAEGPAFTEGCDDDHAGHRCHAPTLVRAGAYPYLGGPARRVAGVDLVVGAPDDPRRLGVDVTVAPKTSPPRG